jgi:hypothetical protein
MMEPEDVKSALEKLPEPAFSKLERLVRARRRTVANLVEGVITGLVDALAPSEDEA